VKLAFVPFPFPYVQTCDCLLAMHWLMVPFVVCQWVTRPWWAGFFCFLQVFTLWVLNLIACELENPFGQDANDVDAIFMQRGFNNHLRLLMQIETWPVPHLSRDCGSQSTLFRKAVDQQETHSSFQAILHYMESHKGSTPPSLKKRFNSRVSRHGKEGKAREAQDAPDSFRIAAQKEVETEPVVTVTVAGNQKMNPLRDDTLTAQPKSAGGGKDVQGAAREKFGCEVEAEPTGSCTQLTADDEALPIMCGDVDRQAGNDLGQRMTADPLLSSASRAEESPSKRFCDRARQIPVQDSAEERIADEAWSFAAASRVSV